MATVGGIIGSKQKKVTTPTPSVGGVSFVRPSAGVAVTNRPSTPIITDREKNNGGSVGGILKPTVTTPSVGGVSFVRPSAGVAVTNRPSTPIITDREKNNGGSVGGILKPTVTTPSVGGAINVKPATNPTISTQAPSVGGILGPNANTSGVSGGANVGVQQPPIVPSTGTGTTQGNNRQPTLVDGIVAVNADGTLTDYGKSLQQRQSMTNMMGADGVFNSGNAQYDAYVMEQLRNGIKLDNIVPMEQYNSTRAKTESVSSTYEPRDSSFEPRDSSLRAATGSFINTTEGVIGGLSGLSNEMKNYGAEGLAAMATQYQSMVDMLDKMQGEITGKIEGQMNGLSNDPQLQAAIGIIRDEVDAQRKSTLEQLNAMGLGQSGILLEMQDRLNKGQASQVQQLVASRFGDLQNQLNAAITNFAGMRVNALDSYNKDVNTFRNQNGQNMMNIGLAQEESNLKKQGMANDMTIAQMNNETQRTIANNSNATQISIADKNNANNITTAQMSIDAQKAIKQGDWANALAINEADNKNTWNIASMQNEYNRYKAEGDWANASKIAKMDNDAQLKATGMNNATTLKVAGINASGRGSSSSGSYVTGGKVSSEFVANATIMLGNLKKQVELESNTSGGGYRSDVITQIKADTSTSPAQKQYLIDLVNKNIPEAWGSKYNPTAKQAGANTYTKVNRADVSTPSGSNSGSTFNFSHRKY